MSSINASPCPLFPFFERSPFANYLDSSDSACYNSIDDAVRHTGDPIKEKELPMTESSSSRSTIVAALRWALALGIGSALVLQEKTKEFAKQAIERGQEAQEEGKKLVQEMREEKRHKHKKRTRALDTQINAALERLNVPTETDIRELNQKVAELSERIDKLHAAT
jgi:polyhydroxyalkanoate synthesis regulator phasin